MSLCTHSDLVLQPTPVHACMHVKLLDLRSMHAEQLWLCTTWSPRSLRLCYLQCQQTLTVWSMHRSFMAWNWYPPVPEGTSKLPPRLHAHADMDVITLLYQRTGEVCVTSACKALDFTTSWLSAVARRTVCDRCGHSTAQRIWPWPML